MKSFAVKEKRSTPVARNRSQPSRFGHRGTESKAQQAEIHNILRSTGAQAKLTIGQPNDKYEQEADRVADQVMRMSEADVAQRVETGTIQPVRIQRMCSECEDEQELQRKPEEEEEMLRAKEMPGHTPEVSPGLESKINNVKGGSQPLDAATLSYFEPRFGHDFSQVRVHTGANAEESARNVNAKAFTLGRDVVFGAGEYSAGSSSSRKLLAHELTHVVQQGGGLADGKGAARIQRQRLSLSDVLEKAASEFLGPVGRQVFRLHKQFIVDLAASVKESPQHVGEFLKDEVWESIKNHWDRIMAVTIGLIVAELAVAVLIAIPEPTLLTKVIAVILQIAIIAIIGHRAVVEVVAALVEGGKWLSTAKKARGDQKVISEASRSFVRMVWHILMAVLAVAGVRARIRGISTPRGATGARPQPTPKAAGRPAETPPEGVIPISRHPGFQPRSGSPSPGQPSASRFGPGGTARQLAPAEQPLTQPVVVPRAPIPAPATAPAPSTTPIPRPGVQPVTALAAGVSAATSAPVMPAGLSRSQKELWRACNQQYNTYTDTKTEFGNLAKQKNDIEKRLHDNTASQKDRVNYCRMLYALIDLVERLQQERRRYMEMDCDRFDWFDKGTTAAERLAKHQREENNVRASRSNLYELLRRFCP